MIGRYSRRSGNSDDRLEELTKKLKKQEEQLKRVQAQIDVDHLNQQIDNTKDTIIIVLKNKYK